MGKVINYNTNAFVRTIRLLIIHLNYLDAIFVIIWSDKYNWNSLANGQGVKHDFFLESSDFFGIEFELLVSLMSDLLYLLTYHIC